MADHRKGGKQLFNHTVWLAVCVLTLGLTIGTAYAITWQQKREALKEIGDFADRLCDHIPIEGSGQNVELSGNARAELSKLASKLADLGIEGAGKYQNSQYEGLLQKDLATELENSRDCKREIFRELKQEFFKEEGGSESSAPTQQPARQVQTMAGRLNKDMLIASNKSRAGGIRFFDPPLDTVIVNNKMFRVDLQFRLPGTYVFRLDRRQQRLRLACALSDEIRKNARYALRVIGDNNRVFEQYYSIGNDPVSKDVDIAGVETLVFDISGSPSGDFMLFYCNDELG